MSGKASRLDSDNETLIETRNLKKNFAIGESSIEALRGVNFKVEEGDFVVVYGPSGCGKSTLLNVMIGIERPTGGKVLVKGVDIYRLSEDRRSSIRASKFGIIYQMPYWVKSLNVLDNVAMPLIVKGIKADSAVQRAKKTLNDMGMENIALQKPTQLSGGQQQKVSLARALVSNPWIIVADEPTGNLDTTSSDEMMGILDTLNKRDEKTIILVTHNSAYWDMGMKIVEMKDGKVVKETKRG